MNKKMMIIITMVLFIIITIVYANQRRVPTAKNIINKLTFENLEGRLVGTSGNEKAGLYIKKLFKKIGLEPWQKDQYFCPYEQTTYNPKKQKLKITYNEKELLLGKDYMPVVLMTQNITAPITFDLDDPDIKTKILICEEAEIAIAMGKQPLHLMAVAENFRGKANVIEEKDNRQIMTNITQQTYNQVKNENPKEMSINFESNIEITEENNVVGKIIGKDPGKAIIISAHYDHVGKWGDLLFQGAIDNASGIATLIKIAEDVQKQKEKMEATIIFVAFNGEENKHQGSINFVNQVVGEYSNIYNINIDCVGDSTTYEIDSEKGAIELIKAIEEAFAADGEIATWVDNGTESSDHQSFLAKNIPAVNITNQELIKKTHTQQDVKEIIDVEAIEQLSKTISNYIISKNHVIMTYKEVIGREIFNPYLYTEAVKKIREEQNMDYDETYTIEVNGQRMKIIGKTKLKEKQEIEKYYPTIRIKETIGEYKFLDLFVNMGFYSNNFINLEDEFIKLNYEHIESNRVFKRDISFETAEHIALRYKHNEYIMEIIITSNTRLREDYDGYKKSPMKGDYSNYNIYEEIDLAGHYLGFELSGQHPKYNVLVSVTPYAETITNEYVVPLQLLWEEDQYEKLVEVIELLDLENKFDDMVQELGL